MPTFFMKFFSGFLLHRQNKQSANSHEAPWRLWIKNFWHLSCEIVRGA
jgi:hypothetical protein